MPKQSVCPKRAQKESKLTTLGLSKLETKAETKSESAATSIEISGTSFPVQAARTNWSVPEQIALISAYKSWDDSSKISQSKKLMPISKIWLVQIPALMGKSFGRVRATPNN